MTLQEKIELATKEVKMATTLLRITRGNVLEWEQTLELRTETLEALKAQATPDKRKVKK